MHFDRDMPRAVVTRFAENALAYQEDFMFMGTNAFLFYFPTLDHYRA